MTQRKKPTTSNVEKNIFKCRPLIIIQSKNTFKHNDFRFCVEDEQSSVGVKCLEA